MNDKETRIAVCVCLCPVSFPSAAFQECLQSTLPVWQPNIPISGVYIPQLLLGPQPARATTAAWPYAGSCLMCVSILVSFEG